MRRLLRSAHGRLVRPLAFLAALLVAVPAAAAASDTGATGAEWPQFQGSADHAAWFRSSRVAPPLKQLWRFEQPGPAEGVAGPVVSGGMAIAVARDSVYAVDISTGKKRWLIDRKRSPAAAAPAIAASGASSILVYTEGKRKTSQVVGYDLDKNKRAWALELRATSSSGVSVDGDRAFVGDRSGRVYAVQVGADQASSKILWTYPGGGVVDSPPAVADGRVYAATRDPTTHIVGVVALDEASGRPRWDFAPSTPAAATSGLAVSGGKVFFGLGDSLARTADAKNGIVEWSSRVRSTFSPVVAGAVVEGDFVIMSTSGYESGLYRLDGVSGQRIWDFEFDTPDVRSSPVVAGHTAFVGLEDGRLEAIDLSSGDMVWEGETGDHSLGSIALAGDALVVSKGGPRSGLVAFVHDPAGRLVHVESPTKLKLGAMLEQFGIAFAGVVAVALLMGLAVRWTRRRRALATAEASS